MSRVSRPRRRHRLLPVVAAVLMTGGCGGGSGHAVGVSSSAPAPVPAGLVAVAVRGIRLAALPSFTPAGGTGENASAAASPTATAPGDRDETFLQVPGVTGDVVPTIGVARQASSSGTNDAAADLALSLVQRPGRQIVSRTPVSVPGAPQPAVRLETTFTAGTGGALLVRQVQLFFDDAAGRGFQVLVRSADADFARYRLAETAASARVAA